jgi:hypothetical protein
VKRAGRAFGQRPGPVPDGAESILKELAKAFKDDRTVEQIKQDNALYRAAAVNRRTADGRELLPLRERSKRATVGRPHSSGSAQR